MGSEIIADVTARVERSGSLVANAYESVCFVCLEWEEERGRTI